MTTEYIRFFLVIIHLLATCVAIGTIISSYIYFMAKATTKSFSLFIEHHIVSTAFILLFISGLGIIYIDIGIITSFEQLLSYKKLSVKMFVVCIIVTNYFFLRFYILRKLTGGDLVKPFQKVLIGFSSGIGLSSWISAAFVGKAKIVAKDLTMMEFIAAYLAFIIVSGIIASIVSYFLDYNKKIT